MLLKHFAIAVAALSAFSEASPAAASYMLHEKRHQPARGFTKLDRVDTSAIIPLRIGLTQNNLHNGYDYLMDVYAGVLSLTSHPDDN